MRRLVLAAAALLGLAGTSSLVAQDTRPLARRLEQARGLSGLTKLPGVEAVTVGTRTIPAGTTVKGPVIVSGGALDVFGDIDGDAVVLDGDVFVRQGGVVRGQAVALGGRVTLDGGRVDGEIRSLTSASDIAAAAAERRALTRTERGAVLAGVVLLALLLGIVTTIMAQPVLDGVSQELERDFGRALLVGFLGELALAPVLGIACVGLVLTLVGILLVPVVVVAYALAAAGLLTLGFLAVARLVGAGLWGGGAARRLSASGASLRAVMIGTVVLTTPWALAVGVGTVWPAGEWLVVLAASGVTWVAVTAGFGATLLSRVGARPVRVSVVASMPVDQYAWATPTPVSGVAAARRPTASSAGGR
jgi:hypothetical protein